MSAYAAAFFHMGFLVAMLAHLIGGVATEEGKQLVIGPEWTELTESFDVRLITMEIDRHPSGQPRGITGHVQLRDSEGVVTVDTVGFNDPIATNYGMDLALLANYVPTLPAANLSVGEQTCRLISGESCEMGAFRIELTGINSSPGAASLAGAGALIEATPLAGGAGHKAFLQGGRPVKLDEGTEVSLNGFDLYPAVLVRRRHVPGIPWALVSAVFLALGAVMMGRRWLMR